MFVWFAFSTLIVISLIGNLGVMWIILNYKTMQYGFNYFLFNMALSDFLIVLLNASLTFPYNFYYEWSFPSVFCTFNHFFGVAPSCSSLFSLIVISHDRCMAIVDPMKKRSISKKRAVLIIGMIWILSIVLSFPNFFAARIINVYMRPSLDSRYYRKSRACSNDFEYKNM